MTENASADLSFGPHPPQVPDPIFSFRFGGVDSAELLPTWETSSSPDSQTWRDPGTGLAVTLERVTPDGYAATEWILRFRNEGDRPTPVLSDVLALDAAWDVPRPLHANPQASVFRSRGSTFVPQDFEYTEERLLDGERLEMVAGLGRSSQYWLPFFLTDLGGFGSVIAIGWSGEWRCRVSHESGRLSVDAGMRNLEVALEPGESIRSPRILQLDWEGDRADAHNQLRRLLLRDYTPHIDGEPVVGPYSLASWGGMGSDIQKERIALYGRENIGQDYFWLDAGWFGADSSYSPDEFQGDWFQFAGDWTVNPDRHGADLKPVAAAAREAGMKFILWAEPGRAIDGTPWPTQHPDWFIRDGSEQLLLDFGNPDARAGAVDLISRLIVDNDVDLYREDYNINPAQYWALQDSPGRVGIAEIRYIEGLYDFWDELRLRHPGLVIDNCASGGRRLDLETIRRTINLWRSDYQCFIDYDPEATQAQTMGISHWLPFHGTGTWASTATTESCSTYRVRSTFAPAFQLSTFPRESQAVPADYPWDWVRKMGEDFLRCRPFFTGDFHPLTPVIGELQQPWSAYQMHADGAGFVMAFRRRASLTPSAVLGLRGLDPERTYVVEDADGGSRRALGSELMTEFDVTLPPESSALFFYTPAP